MKSLARPIHSSVADISLSAFNVTSALLQDCPILGLDIVARNGQFAFTVADLSPVSAEDSGPPTRAWLETLNASLRQTLRNSSARAAPDWGKEIFSDNFTALQPNVRG